MNRKNAFIKPETTPDTIYQNTQKLRRQTKSDTFIPKELFGAEMRQFVPNTKGTLNHRQNVIRFTEQLAKKYHLSDPLVQKILFFSILAYLATNVPSGIEHATAQDDDFSINGQDKHSDSASSLIVPVDWQSEMQKIWPKDELGKEIVKQTNRLLSEVDPKYYQIICHDIKKLGYLHPEELKNKPKKLRKWLNQIIKRSINKQNFLLPNGVVDLDLDGKNADLTINQWLELMFLDDLIPDSQVKIRINNKDHLDYMGLAPSAEPIVAFRSEKKEKVYYNGEYQEYDAGVFVTPSQHGVSKIVVGSGDQVIFSENNSKQTEKFNGSSVPAPEITIPGRASQLEEDSLASIQPRIYPVKENQILVSAGIENDSAENIELPKNFNPLLEIIKKQGKEFDEWTYNRLADNYSVGIAVVEDHGKERLLISSSNFYVKQTGAYVPSDIKEKLKKYKSPITLAEKINKTTIFNKNLNKELREAVWEALQLNHQIERNDPLLEIRYNQDNSIEKILYEGKEIDVLGFMFDIQYLKPVSENVKKEVGGIKYKINIRDYFKKLIIKEKKLKEQGAADAYITLENNSTNISKSRNVFWEVDKTNKVYKEIVQQLINESDNTYTKLTKIGTWVQKYMDYIDEKAIGIMIDKTSEAVLLDMGGACDDLTPLFLNLAIAAGLEKEVATVAFEGHIAPMIKGKFGEVTYQIEGENWTVYDMSMPKGKTLKPGQLVEVYKRMTPKVYQFGLKDLRPADPTKYIIPKLVKTEELNPQAVTSYRNIIENLKNWFIKRLETPYSSKAEVDQSAREMEEHLNRLDPALRTITNSGKVSGEVIDIHWETHDFVSEMSDQLIEKAKTFIFEDEMKKMMNR